MLRLAAPSTTLVHGAKAQDTVHATGHDMPKREVGVADTRVVPCDGDVVLQGLQESDGINDGLPFPGIIVGISYPFYSRSGSQFQYYTGSHEIHNLTPEVTHTRLRSLLDLLTM